MKKYGFLAAVAATTLIGCASAPQPTVEPAAPKAEPAPVAEPVKKDTLMTQYDRYSYALGMNIGQSLKDVFALGLNSELVLQGMQAELDSSSKKLMTDAEVESTLQALILEVQTKREAAKAEETAKLIASQKAFLETNKTAEGVVTTPSGLQYKITQTSEGIAPTRNDKVKVHYRGTLLDGKQFDSSYDRGEPLQFPVSAVIEGWQELLVNMKSGMKATAWIPSELGYGEAGVPPMIPANALLVFEVELLEVVQANPTPADTLAPAAAPAVPENAKVVEPATVEAKAETKTEAAPAAEAKPAEAPKAEVKAAEPKKEEAKKEAPAKAEAKPAAKK